MSDAPDRTSSGGQILGQVGDFELIAKLGQGAMGAVFKARQVMLDRIVALKVLPPAIASDKSFIERFVREARACAKLSHPNVVAGIAVGQDEKTNLWYFAMEFVDGPTVKQIMDRQGRIPEDQALKMACDIARALDCAHQAGMVHRDVKPDNILLMSDGMAKLADLGLARQTHEDSSLTQSGQALGTPYYMAPEQARGENETLDTRADLYALGATLFHMVTGVPPFTGETSAVIMAKHLQEQPPLAHQVYPDVSQGCSRMIHRLMQKDKAKRCQTPRDLVDQIEGLLELPVNARGEATGVRRAVRTTTGAQGAVRGTAAVQDVVRGRKSRDSGKGEPAPDESKFLPFVIGGVVGLVALVLIGIFAFARSDKGSAGAENREPAKQNPVPLAALPDAPVTKTPPVATQPPPRKETSHPPEVPAKTVAEKKPPVIATTSVAKTTPRQPKAGPDTPAPLAGQANTGRAIPPDKLLSLLNTAVTGREWHVQDDAIAGTVGSIDDHTGKILMREPFSARSFEYSLGMIAKQYQAIMVTVDGQLYYYSRGHWSNTGGFCSSPAGPDRRRGKETVTDAGKWATLECALADDLLVFKYNGEVMAKCPVKTNTGGTHEVRVGFGSHAVPVSVKDFTLSYR